MSAEQKKRRSRLDKCQEQRREYIDEPDPEDQNCVIRRQYLTCKLESNGIPCPYTARLCRYRLEIDEQELLLAHANGEIE